MTKPRVKSKPAAEVTPSRKKLTLKKNALKDLSTKTKGADVKGGANYSRSLSGAY